MKRLRIKEWLVSHALWDLFVAALGAIVASIGGAKLMHAAFDVAVNLFLVIVGLLGIAWGTGFLPKRRPNQLVNRHRDLVLAWTQLDTTYQAWAKQMADVPPTLPDPMSASHWGIGDLQFRYRVGVLQGKTRALLDDFSRVGIDVGYEKADIRSVPELLRVLERSKL